MAHEAAEVTAAYAACFDVARFGEREDWVMSRRPAPLTALSITRLQHVHSLSKVRPDAGGDRGGSARGPGLRALRALLERVQCARPAHGRAPGPAASGEPDLASAAEPDLASAAEPDLASAAAPDLASAAEPDPASAAEPGPAAAEAAGGAQPPGEPAGGTVETSASRSGGGHSRSGARIQPRHDRRDGAVFVEPAPDPQWTAATGTFKAMIAANQDGAEGAAAGASRTGAGEPPPPPADTAVEVEVDAAFLARLLSGGAREPPARCRARRCGLAPAPAARRTKRGDAREPDAGAAGDTSPAAPASGRRRRRRMRRRRHRGRPGSRRTLRGAGRPRRRQRPPISPQPPALRRPRTAAAAWARRAALSVARGRRTRRARAAGADRASLPR